MAIVAAGVDVRGLANIEELPNAPPQTHNAVSCSRIYLHKLEFFVAMPSIKREATSLATQPIDVDAPRAKRHKPAQPSVSATSQANDDQKQHTDASSVVQSASAKTEGAAAKEDPETVKERGLRLWQVIKDATNKECVCCLSILERFFFNEALLLTSIFSRFTLVEPSLFDVLSQIINKNTVYHDVKRSSFVARLPSFAVETTVPRLLRADQATGSSRRDQA